jgi:hypothetical protein
LTRRDNQPQKSLRTKITAAIITTAVTPDSNPDWRAPIIKIVAPHLVGSLHVIVSDVLRWCARRS